MNNLSTAYEKTFSCVQCGMCLPSCPTYLTLKTEKHSPRGRINLLKMYTENKLSIEDIKEGFEVCLGCMACQTVCPTGVDYSYIHHTAIEMLKNKQKESKPLKYHLFKESLNIALSKEPALKSMKKSMHLLQRVIHKDHPLLNTVGQKNKLFYQSLPQQQQVSPIVQHETNRKYKVAYFKGCVMDVMFEAINKKAIALLEAHGVEVITVPNEICCGALTNHAGYTEDAKRLAIENIKRFENISCDYIVNAIGGCGATLKTYPSYFDETETEWLEKAQNFSEKNIDISVMLSKLDLQINNILNYKVTYQPSCHLTNVQHVHKKPEDIIKKIKGIEYNELVEKDICCGSAGIYNIIQYENAMKVLDRKMQHVKNTQTNVIVTSNPGCYLQMQLGINKEGLESEIKVMHLVDLVYEACL